MSKMDDLKAKLQEQNESEKKAKQRTEQDLENWLTALHRLYDSIENMLEPLNEQGVTTRRSFETKTEFNSQVETPILHIKNKDQEIKSNPIFYSVPYKARADFEVGKKARLILVWYGEEKSWKMLISDSQGRTQGETADFTEDDLAVFLDNAFPWTG
ncbi:hypothetical protein F0A16_17735 [Salinicola corii]|uniref:Uncharacterized protein n=1 Tax=Salinicola corii TaxID=2606937 RepID=A0A640WAN6_9GAMM|nr:hypothetical protein [Salinicola corii]KAA0016278.1 hypothetical protein F0A16_17735 [Salinicola corii]